MILLFYSVEPPKKSAIKKYKSTWGVHFTTLPASPCAAKFYEIWRVRSARRQNYLSQIFSQSVQGLQSSDISKIALSHWVAASRDRA